MQPPPPPVLVNLESSLACNLRCPMCAPYRTGSTRRSDRMDPALLDRLAREVLPHAELVELTMAGEPFLHPDLLPFVALSEQLGFRFRIQCNGTVLPPPTLRRRLLARTEVLSVSLDAADRDLYAELRGRDLYDRVLANLHALVQERDALAPSDQPRLGLAVVLMGRTLDQLLPLLALAADLGLDEVAASHLTAFDDAHDADSLRHQPERADAVFAQARAEARRLDLRLSLPPPMHGSAPGPTVGDRVAHLRFALTHGPDRRLRRWLRLSRRRLAVRAWERRSGGRVPCDYLRSRVYVGVDGQVRPCCMPEHPVVGDLRRESFAQAWSGETLTAMRRAFVDGAPWDCCRRCSANRAGDYRPADPDTARPPTVQL